MKKRNKIILYVGLAILFLIIILIPILFAKKNSIFLNELGSLSSLSVILIIIGSFLEIMLILNDKFYNMEVSVAFNNFKKYSLYLLCCLFGSLLFTVVSVLLLDGLVYKAKKPEIINVTDEFIISGNTRINKDVDSNGQTFESSRVDESVILVENKGNLKVNKANINKVSGNSSNADDSRDYGINSAVLVLNGGTANINNSFISSLTSSSSGIYSVGSESKVILSNTSIDTEKNSSKGIEGINDSLVEGSDITVNTKGNNAPAFFSVNSKINLKNSKVYTKGSGSPIVYSNGAINMYGVEGDSTNSPIVVLENGTVLLDTCSLSTTGIYSPLVSAAIVIDRTSETDNTNTSVLNIKNSKLNIFTDSLVYKNASMFSINSVNAVINLEDNKFSYSNNILFNVTSTKDFNSLVNVSATNQSLNGNIVADMNSEVLLNLTNSNYKGSINNINKLLNISIKLDKSSTLELTNNTYVKSFEDVDKKYKNIQSNGYNIYYDANVATLLNGKTIKLPGGGSLLPYN